MEHKTLLVKHLLTKKRGLCCLRIQIAGCVKLLSLYYFSSEFQFNAVKADPKQRRLQLVLIFL